MKKLQSKKSVYIIVATIIALIVFVWMVLVYNNVRIRQIYMEDYSIFTNYEEGYWFNLDYVISTKDDVSITKDYISVAGWIVDLNNTYDRVDYRVVLRNCSTGEAYAVPTVLVERQDVTSAFNNGNNYDWSGFTVKIPYSSKIDTEKYDYDIMILLKVNDNIPVIVDSGKNTGDYR